MCQAPIPDGIRPQWILESVDNPHHHQPEEDWSGGSLSEESLQRRCVLEERDIHLIQWREVPGPGH